MPFAIKQNKRIQFKGVWEEEEEEERVEEEESSQFY
jgi:hypothetical protein